jgi:hypothetical protein
MSPVHPSFHCLSFTTLDHPDTQMTMTTQALAVLQQLYTPNILVLVSRLLVQAQIGAAPFVHPTRSLAALFLMLVVTNFAAVFLHCLDFWAELNGGKGVVLDFVGQCECHLPKPE